MLQAPPIGQGVTIVAYAVVAGLAANPEVVVARLKVADCPF